MGAYMGACALRGLCLFLPSHTIAVSLPFRELSLLSGYSLWFDGKT